MKNVESNLVEWIVMGCRGSVAVTILLMGAIGFGQDEPNLPAIAFDYAAYSVTNLPEHYLPTAPFADAGAANNTPLDNPITNAGATLGRVLFYDRSLSINRSISCASCHTQATGFADPRQFSFGHSGLPTLRHSMGLTNAVFYASGRFRWDETASTLEEQCLIPIEAEAEMGLSLSELRERLETTPFYEPLFVDAFGDGTVTDDRIAKALAQFVRAMVSYNSKYDHAYEIGDNGFPDFETVFSKSELLGRQLFERTPDSIGCHQCHASAANIGDMPRNIGLDPFVTDPGAGNGMFKVPSLRNIGVRGRFMHDGRFTSLAEVVDFYDHGVQDNPFLDALLRVDDNPEGPVEVHNLSKAEKQAMNRFYGNTHRRTILERSQIFRSVRPPSLVWRRQLGRYGFAIGCRGLRRTIGLWPLSK